MSDNIKPIGGSWGAAECFVCGHSWKLAGPIETETPRCPNGCFDEALQGERGPQTQAEVIEALFADINELHAKNLDLEDKARHWRDEVTRRDDQYAALLEGHIAVVDERDHLRSQLSARDAEVRALQFDQRDLVAIVGRLCRTLSQDDDRRIQAMEYLKRKNLLGSVLRAHTGEPGPGGEHA